MNLASLAVRPSVRALLKDWCVPGELPDALAFFTRYPHLAEDGELVGELAYEEFWLRRQAGETIDVEAFCSQFPAHQDYLLAVIGSDVEMAGHPSRADRIREKGEP